MYKRYTFLALLFPLFSIAQPTPICQIQGNGADSPVAGTSITTSGVVSALFNGPDQLDGFFLQDDACDADVLTSNGIFVYDPGGPAVQVGDEISLDADVSEYFGLTELSNVSNLVTIANNQNIDTTDIILPISNQEELERYESMLVRFPQTLVATDNFNLGRFGEVIFSVDDRLSQPSNIVDPNDDPASGTTNSGNSNVSNLIALQEFNDNSTILLDDASTIQFPASLPYTGPEGTLRCGSQITGMTGVLSYSFGKYRLQPTDLLNINHALRPTPPDIGSGSIKVVSYNVLNFFTTLNVWGATSSGELWRQRTKLLFALSEMNADVFGLMEMENNGAAAYTDLLDSLNALMGAGTYAALDAADPGAYQTKSVIFYKPATLTPIGALNSLNDPIFERPTLSQVFEVQSNGSKFNFVLNHLRFKGCDGATGLDLDQGDGQACFNETRRLQVLSMLHFVDTIVASTGVDKVLITGDFNAYAQEDPIDIIEAGGYERLLDLDEYSFVFFGQFGALDHAFASPSISSAITGADIWHLNSDEPRSLDYNDDNLDHFQFNSFRSSDHDPVIIAIDPNELLTSIDNFSEPSLVSVFPNPFTETVNFEFELTGSSRISLEVFDQKGGLVASVFAGTLSAGKHVIPWTPQLSSGAYLYKLSVENSNGTKGFSEGKFISIK